MEAMSEEIMQEVTGLLQTADGLKALHRGLRYFLNQSKGTLIDMVKVLIVDDLTFMRNAISSILSSDPDIKIIGTARDGQEAIDKAVILKQDVVTMDIEIPKMDGITAFRHLI